MGERAVLAGIMPLVAQALADRAAFWLTLIALAAGAVTFVAWRVTGADTAFAVEGQPPMGMGCSW